MYYISYIYNIYVILNIICVHDSYYASTRIYLENIPKSENSVSYYIYTDQLQEIMPNCFPKRSYHILLPTALYEHSYESIFFSGIFRHVNILQTK